MANSEATYKEIHGKSYQLGDIAIRTTPVQILAWGYLLDARGNQRFAVGFVKVWPPGEATTPE
jgi:hypothetical protein